MKIPTDSLAGKNALVTGAGSGIGRATAKLLAHAGAKVALLGHTRSELEKVIEELGGEASGHLLVVADVSNPIQMEEAFATMGKRWESLQVVVANAGINGVWAPLRDLAVEEWDKTLEVNLRGTFLTVKLALPWLGTSGASVIVVSSVNGTRMFSNSGASAYACSKAAQVAFARMIALELAKDKIRVNTVCPGAINTHINDSTERRELDGLHLPVEFPDGDVPLKGGHAGTAGEVAQLIWFLASDAASHITGTEVYIEGAQSLLQG